MPAFLFESKHIAISTLLCGSALFSLYPHEESALLQPDVDKSIKKILGSVTYSEYVKTANDKKSNTDKIIHISNKLTEQGYWQESNDLLKKLATNSEKTTQQTMNWLFLNNNLIEYYIAQKNTDLAVIEKNHLKIIDQLKKLAGYPDWDNLIRQKLAKHSTDFGLHTYASYHYAVLANTDQTHELKWLELAAEQAKNANHWQAAELYLNRLNQQANTQGLKVGNYAADWLESLLRANKKQQAIDYINKNLTNFQFDNDSLKKIATVSTQLGNPTLTAKLYATLAIDDPINRQTWYEKAAYWAQAAHQYPEAATYLQQAHLKSESRLEKAELEHRVVDLWLNAKQPATALKTFTYLIKQGASKTLLKQGIQLARLSDEQKNTKIASYYWAMVTPQITDQHTIESIVRWQASKHRYTLALKTMSMLEAKFGRTNQSTLMKVQLYWESRQKQNALKLIKGNYKRLLATATPYQRSILKELASKPAKLLLASR